MRFRSDRRDEHGVIELSLSELDAAGRKAARGAGYAWGLAEEAGRAARDLAATGADGALALLRVLEALDAEGGVGPAAHAPVPGADAWRATGGTWSCPISAGASLSDRAHRFATGESVTLERVLVPALIVPMVERAGRALGHRVESFRVEPDGTEDPVSPDGIGPSTVRIRFAPSDDVPCAPRAAPAQGRCRTARSTLRALEALAHRTYVPASDASRAGAGGASDDG